MILRYCVSKNWWSVLCKQKNFQHYQLPKGESTAWLINSFHNNWNAIERFFIYNANILKRFNYFSFDKVINWKRSAIKKEVKWNFFRIRSSVVDKRRRLYNTSLPILWFTFLDNTYEDRSLATWVSHKQKIRHYWNFYLVLLLKLKRLF